MVSHNKDLPSLKSQLNRTPVRDKVMLRTLYLVQGLTPTQIQNMGVGYSAKQVSLLACRLGWSKLKAQALLSAEKAANDHVDNSIREVTEAIAQESEELALKALDVTRSGLDAGGEKGAKQAQAASSTLRNLVQVSRLLRTPEGKEPLGNTSLQINFFGVGKSEPKPVTPSTDVINVESKPV